MNRLRGNDAARPGDAAAFYRLANDGSAEALEALTQRVRWSEGNAAADASTGTTFAAATTVSDLLEYRDPRTGLTPLMAAVVKGYLGVARQLLEYGAPVDAVDALKGRTALHRAVKGSVMMYSMDAKVVTLLLEAGANPFCGDSKGFTAVDYTFQRRMTMSHRIPNSFELIMRSIIHVAIFAGPFEVKLNRIMGLARGWNKMYCVLVPFSPHVDEPVTQLQLLFVDERLLTLTDKVWVTESRSEACAIRARMHIDLIVRRQNRAMNVYMCEVGNQEMKLQLRALDESLAESTRLSKLVELAAIEPAEAAEFPARRLAAGTSFRGQPTPSDVHRGRDTSTLNRDSVSRVQRSADSPRDAHSQSQSLPTMRMMSRSRSRDRGNRTGSLTDEEEQAAGIEVKRAVGPGSALQGVAEAPAGVNDALAAAREDYRNNKLCMATRSDSARMPRPLETLNEVV